MGGERVAHVGGNIHHTLVAKGCHGRPVLVKGVFDLLVHSEFGVISQLAQQI